MMVAQKISTHVPRAGDDLDLSGTPITSLPFQPTSPVRETTQNVSRYCNHSQISTHVPRAGDDVVLIAVFVASKISTHVPRAGDD